MLKKNPSTESSVTVFKYDTVKNISSPEDHSGNRKVYSGHAPLTSILDLPTDENVRAYLAEAEGKKRKRYTQVHREIFDTLRNRPDIFSVLNGGVTIVARSVEIDEKTKLLKLKRASIINGSQTQGVVRDFFKEAGELYGGTHIKFELVITDDEDLIAAISISRNFQNDVMTVSIAGRLGQLDELEEAMQNEFPEMKLRKTETDLTDMHLDTEKLVQVILALTPSELWPKQSESGDPNKVYTYSAKTKCLKEFQTVYEKAKNSDDPEHDKYLKLYKYYLDIAPMAWRLYMKWKSHSGWIGTGIRSIVRENGKVKDVPDGLVFPIIASLSPFVTHTKKGWKFHQPEELTDAELVGVADRAYKEIADHNPQTMGKTKACYSALFQITSIYQRLLRHEL